MKRNNQAAPVETTKPSAKEEFLQELDQESLEKVAGGMWGSCMNGCGGRCGGCNCSVQSYGGGGWW